MKYHVLMLKDNDTTACKHFMRYDWAMAHGGINLDDYETVYSGIIAPHDQTDETLEEIYTLFNITPPEDYTGRSMCVSDIVILDDVGTFYCDSFGFRELDAQMTICDK